MVVRSGIVPRSQITLIMSFTQGNSFRTGQWGNVGGRTPTCKIGQQGYAFCCYGHLLAHNSPQSGHWVGNIDAGISAICFMVAAYVKCRVELMFTLTSQVSHCVLRTVSCEEALFAVKTVITYNWWGWSNIYVYPGEIVQTPLPCTPQWCRSCNKVVIET